MENVFFDIVERKNTFFGYKNKKFKKSKNWHITEGVSLSIWLVFFQALFLGNIDQENVFYYIEERKNTFLGYKSKTFKMSKNWHFSKGVSPKLAIFATYFFSQYRAGKFVLWYSRTKTHLSRL